MHITVKFFASLKEQFDQAELDLELDSNHLTISDVWQHVSQTDYMPANVLSAINLEYAQADQAVNNGDEVAFFPPVTGG